jgi:hypothetical protein
MLPRESRDTTQPLEKVQRHTFTCQQGARTAADTCDASTGKDVIATASEQFNICATAKLKDQGQEFNACQSEVLFREEASACAQFFGYGQPGCDVAIPHVFSKGPLHGGPHIGIIDFEHYAQFTRAKLLKAAQQVPAFL